MKDRTGKPLEVGQVVELAMYQVVSAYVAEIKDAPVALANGRIKPAQVLLQIMLPLLPDEGGMVDAYVIRESRMPKPVANEAAPDDKEKPKLVVVQ